MDQIVLLVLGIAALSLALTMLAMVDLIKRDFPSIKTKFLWHFVALIPLVGWLIYFVFGRKQGQKKDF